MEKEEFELLARDLGRHVAEEILDCFMEVVPDEKVEK